MKLETLRQKSIAKWKGISYESETVEDSDKSFETLSETLSEVRAEYEKRYYQLHLENIDEIRQLLKLNDWKLDRIYPDVGSDSYSFYSQYEKQVNIQRHNNQYARRFFKYNFRTKVCSEREDLLEILKGFSVSQSNAVVDSYIRKLMLKIGKEIETATCNGNIWDCAVLEVITHDGEKQIWNTNCILNRSKLGKIFNQWPTRRVS